MDERKTKTIGKSVVSYSTFLDLLDSMGGFIENVDFFVDATFKMDAWEKSMPFIHDQIENARKELSEIEKKALREGEKLGTNVPNKSQPTETIEDTKQEDISGPTGLDDYDVLYDCTNKIQALGELFFCKGSDGDRELGTEECNGIAAILREVGHEIIKTIERIDEENTLLRANKSPVGQSEIVTGLKNAVEFFESI